MLSSLVLLAILTIGQLGAANICDESLLLGQREASIFPVQVGEQQLWIEAQQTGGSAAGGQLESLSFSGIKVYFDPELSQAYFLQSAFGQGAAPLDILCAQMTQGRAPYASSYNQLDTRPRFGGRHDFAVIHGAANGHPPFVEVASDYSGDLYYRGLLCFTFPVSP